MDELLQAIGSLVLSIVLIFYRFFVCTKVWNYIAVKMFHFPVIGMWQAFAISTLLGIFTVNYGDISSREKDQNKTILYGFCGVTLSWVISWLVFG